MTISKEEVEAVMNRIGKEKNADIGYSVGKDEPCIKW